MARTVKDPEERRSELLACAMRLFDEEGYDNVSVRAVARAAGVAPALAYHSPCARRFGPIWPPRWSAMPRRGAWPPQMPARSRA